MEAEQDIEMEAQPGQAAQSSGEDSADLQRREFLKRFGAYSAGVAVGMYILMKPSSGLAAGDTSEPTGGGTNEGQ